MIENPKLSDRCLYCGKKRVKEFSSFCSEECRNIIEKKTKEWEEQGLCIWGCGNPVFVSKKDGKRYRACFNCLAEMTSAFNHLDKLFEIAEGK